MNSPHKQDRSLGIEDDFASGWEGGTSIPRGWRIQPNSPTSVFRALGRSVPTWFKVLWVAGAALTLGLGAVFVYGLVVAVQWLASN